MSTAIVPYFPDPEIIGAFAKLPAPIKKKIRIDGPEREACWHWTGSFTPARCRYKAYHVPDDYDGFRNFTGCPQNERGVPNVRFPGKKGAVPAHRAVFACVTGTPYDEVPQLGRCSNDRCVSPHHVTMKDLSPYDIRRRAAGLLEPVLGSGAPGEVRDALRRLRPFTGSQPAIAEEECNLPPGSITPEIWLEYVHWDEANPDPDEG